MEFIVKSRLLRSSSILDANSTVSGCLPSLYSPSVLNVVISKTSESITTDTVPCLMPVGTTLYSAVSKTSVISSGVALVVKSQSFGVLPTNESLTQPPTRYASNAFFSNNEKQP